MFEVLNAFNSHLFYPDKQLFDTIIEVAKKTIPVAVAFVRV
jgi:hypothetical protein